MKEDITQRLEPATHALRSCGLVMKEDITQREIGDNIEILVVVW